MMGITYPLISIGSTDLPKLKGQNLVPVSDGPVRRGGRKGKSVFLH